MALLLHETLPTAPNLAPLSSQIATKKNEVLLTQLFCASLMSVPAPAPRESTLTEMANACYAFRRFKKEAAFMRSTR
jgi:hypothetical protein